MIINQPHRRRAQVVKNTRRTCQCFANLQMNETGDGQG